MERFYEAFFLKVKPEAIRRGEFNPGDGVYVIGHKRPAHRYIKEMERAGFGTKDESLLEVMGKNPYQILENNSILAACCGYKKNINLNAV